MKITIIALVFLSPFLINGQTNPFNKLDYNKVVAYEYQGEGRLLIEECLKKEKEKINNTKELTDKQVEKLESILTSSKGYGNIAMSCFDPHFAVVYYKDQTIVGTITICLDCNYLTSSEKIPATELKIIKVSEDYYYPVKGFSKGTRKEIYDYIKGLGFEKYLKPLESYPGE